MRSRVWELLCKRVDKEWWMTDSKSGSKTCFLYVLWTFRRFSRRFWTIKNYKLNFLEGSFILCLHTECLKKKIKWITLEIPTYVLIRDNLSFNENVTMFTIFRKSDFFFNFETCFRISGSPFQNREQFWWILKILFPKTSPFEYIHFVGIAHYTYQKISRFF